MGFPFFLVFWRIICEARVCIGWGVNVAGRKANQTITIWYATFIGDGDKVLTNILINTGRCSNVESPPFQGISTSMKDLKHTKDHAPQQEPS